jgi:predicted DNA-binding transcriptional regulator AlpA
MVIRILRYSDLQAAGVVNNRSTLYRWIRDYGFPSGFLIGPNSRGWVERDVERWLLDQGVLRNQVSGSRSDG